MTEEDTFRALKKATFDTVDQATDVLWLDCRGNHVEYLSKVKPLLADLGWDWNEWNDAYVDSLNKRLRGLG